MITFNHFNTSLIHKLLHSTTTSPHSFILSLIRSLFLSKIKKNIINQGFDKLTTYCVDLDNRIMIELKCSTQLQEMKHMFFSWYIRLLTVVRITIVKTLIISKITHSLISLPNPPSKTIFEIERNVLQNIWKSKTHTVSTNLWKRWATNVMH